MCFIFCAHPTGFSHKRRLCWGGWGTTRFSGTGDLEITCTFTTHVDSLDWKDLSAAEITKRVTERVQPGSIVLFHNAALHTPEALPTIIETLIQKGYGFVPISQLIITESYEIDHTGKQYPVKQS